MSALRYYWKGTVPPLFQLLEHDQNNFKIPRAAAVAHLHVSHRNVLVPDGDTFGRDPADQTDAADACACGCWTPCASLVAVARSWRLWVLAFQYFVTFGGFLAAIVWLPEYYTAYFHVPKGDFNYVGLCIFAAAGAQFSCVFVTDRQGGKRLALIGMLCAFLGAATLMCATAYAVAVTGAFVLSIGMGVANAATYLLLTSCFPTMVGTAAGWVLGLGFCGTFALKPLMVRFGFQDGWSILVVLTGVGAVVAFCFVASHSTPYVDVV